VRSGDPIPSVHENDIDGAKCLTVIEIHLEVEIDGLAGLNLLNLFRRSKGQIPVRSHSETYFFAFGEVPDALKLNAAKLKGCALEVHRILAAVSDAKLDFHSLGGSLKGIPNAVSPFFDTRFETYFSVH
jgi:hypothetical protein